MKCLIRASCLRKGLTGEPLGSPVLNAQHEEFKHFGMDLEFLLRRNPVWREILQDILFQPVDIVEHGEEAEEEANES